MKRQVFLSIIHENPYFCFLEAVGWYKEDSQHCVIREKNELNCFNLHVVISGNGYIKSKNEINILQQGDSFLYFPLE